MKRIKIVALAMFTLATIVNVNAQDANNPWAVSAGINSVDVYGGSKFLNDWLGFGNANGKDDYNLIPTISRVTAERYLSDGFTLQLAGSLNRINTVSTTDDADLVHSSVDVNLKDVVDGLG